MGKKFQFGKMKKFWKWVAQQCKYNNSVKNTTELNTYK